MVQDSVFCSGHLGSFQMSGLGLMGCVLSGGRGLSQGICRMRHIRGLVPTDTCPIATAGHCSMMEASVMEGRSLGDQPGQQDQWWRVQALPMPALLCLLLSSSTIHLPRSLSAWSLRGRTPPLPWATLSILVRSIIVAYRRQGQGEGLPDVVASGGQCSL